IVAEASTNRRHMHKHADIYRKWAEKNNFESKLPDDVETRKKAAAEAEEAKRKLEQQTLDPHLREKPARIVPYSDDLFKQVALEWLISESAFTLLIGPLDALTHPKFVEMIDVAARAHDGVKIPGRKATREEILNLFHQQMENLRVRIHVSW
ncbi:hypothetical protein C8R43DRAFT_820665, partial [Mycena crocata]